MNISLRLIDGSKQKIKLDQIKWVKIRLTNSIKFSIRDESGNTVKHVINSYVVFEHPFSTKGKPKPTLIQLLNSGFDSRIKIFADSNVATDK
jgi:hypothetical protein